jgi:hypothetical protein
LRLGRTDGVEGIEKLQTAGVLGISYDGFHLGMIEDPRLLRERVPSASEAGEGTYARRAENTTKIMTLWYPPTPSRYAGPSLSRKGRGVFSLQSLGVAFN